VELLLFEWRPHSLVRVTAAVAVSTGVCRGLPLGSSPVFAGPAGGTPGPVADGLAIVPGLTGGVLPIAATALM
jgi:CIC family chloride channel protein